MVGAKTFDRDVVAVGGSVLPGALSEDDNPRLPAVFSCWAGPASPRTRTVEAVDKCK